MLMEETYICSDYKLKSIFEPKERIIYVLPFYPDRIIQHAIMNILEPVFDSMFYENSFACRKGKGQHRASQTCMKFVRNSKYCLQCDISKFYPSINHKILKELLEHKFKDKKLLRLFNTIIDSINDESNVPIGNYMSQWFGNFYMTELDRFCYEKLNCKKYFRYCDDFVLFGDCKKELNYWREEIKEFLSDKLKLSLSKAEIYPVSQGIDIVGYRHFPNKILLRKSTAKRISKRINNILNQFSRKEIELDSAIGKVASAKGWLSHAQTYNLKIKLDIFNVWDKLMEIKKYSDFKKTSNALEGDKLRIVDILDKEIIILNYRILPSKIKDAKFCLQIQYKFTDSEKLYISFTNSVVIKNLLEESKNEIPFLVTIKKEKNYYIFT